jgi:hypothetical protein
MFTKYRHFEPDQFNPPLHTLFKINLIFAFHLRQFLRLHPSVHSSFLDPHNLFRPFFLKYTQSTDVLSSQWEIKFQTRTKQIAVQILFFGLLDMAQKNKILWAG